MLYWHTDEFACLQSLASSAYIYQDSQQQNDSVSVDVKGQFEERHYLLFAFDIGQILDGHLQSYPIAKMSHWWRQTFIYFE